MFEKICHTLGGLDGRYHQKVCIHVGEVSVADLVKEILARPAKAV